jgi:hypothetical protein
MKPFVFVAFQSRFESVRVAGTFAIPTDESRIQIDRLEFFKLMGLSTFGQIVRGAVNERANYGLVSLTDFAEMSGIVPEFFSFKA